MATFEFEGNNDEFTANTGLLGTTIGGQLNATDDEDYFKFTVSSSELLNFNFKPPANAEADSFIFKILDSSLNVIFSGKVGSDAINLQLSAVPDTYFVVISANQNNLAAFNYSQYGLTVTTLPARLVLGEIENNNTFEDATNFDIGQGTPLVEKVNLPNVAVTDSIIGDLSDDTDKDYYRFQIDQKGTYTLKFNASSTGEEPDEVDPADAVNGVIKEFFKISILDSTGTNVLVTHYVSDVPAGAGFTFDFGANLTGDYYVLIENGNSTISQNNLQYDIEINPTENTSIDPTLSGSYLKDYLLGTSANDYIHGQLGNDILLGMDGNDRLDGGAGNDTLKGGTGNDTYYVDSASDLVIENSGDGTDLVITTINLSTLAKNVENLQLAQAVLTTKVVGATKGTGNELDNIIVGNQLANALSGLAGDDTLDGGINTSLTGGAVKGDSLTGGLGDDTYYINSSLDSITESANQGIDTALARVDIDDLDDNVENLKLLDMGTDANNQPIVTYGVGNTLNNVIEGNNNSNQLYGLAGNDILYGGGGNDALIGGAGNDTLFGDSGYDLFIFEKALSKGSALNVDTIADFEQGYFDDNGNLVAADMIFLAKDIFTQLPIGTAAGNFNGELNPDHFVSVAGTPIAGDANDYILYNSTTGDLYYDSDGSGAKTAILFANLGSNVDLSAEHFTVF